MSDVETVTYELEWVVVEWKAHSRETWTSYRTRGEATARVLELLMGPVKRIEVFTREKRP